VSNVFIGRLQFRLRIPGNQRIATQRHHPAELGIPSDPRGRIFPDALPTPAGNLNRAMPIYEYVCMSCESHFEELVRDDETPACPDCGSKKAKKQFSVFATHGVSQQPSFGGASGGGGCCGGSCGCGH
jgi:putative FmdB family regulatory protein